MNGPRSAGNLVGLLLQGAVVSNPISHDDTQILALDNPTIIRSLQQILAKQEELERMIRASFAGGDYEGHRRYHENVIQEQQDRRKMRSAIIEQVIKGSVWALLVTVGAACWQYLRDHLK